MLTSAQGAQVKDMYMLMNNLLATSQTYLTLKEHVFKKKNQKHNNTHGTGINMRKHAHKAIRLLQAICSHEKLLEGCRALEGLRWMVKGVCL